MNATHRDNQCQNLLKVHMSKCPHNTCHANHINGLSLACDKPLASVQLQNQSEML